MKGGSTPYESIVGGKFYRFTIHHLCTSKADDHKYGVRCTFYVVDSRKERETGMCYWDVICRQLGVSKVNESDKVLIVYANHESRFQGLPRGKNLAFLKPATGVDANNVVSPTCNGYSISEIEPEIATKICHMIREKTHKFDYDFGVVSSCLFATYDST